MASEENPGKSVKLDLSFAFKRGSIGADKLNVKQHSRLLDFHCKCTKWYPFENQKTLFSIPLVRYKDSTGIPLVKWTRITRPKRYGGSEIKKPFWFSKALTAKSVWRLAHNSQLWGRVMAAKYFPGRSIVDWFREPVKSVANCSIGWKAMVEAFI